MTSIPIGNNQLNPSPCDDEGWDQFAQQASYIINVMQGDINNLTTGTSDHKASIDATDEAATGYDYLFAKLAHHDTITADDRLCRVQNNGDGTMSYFVQVNDLGGGGGSDAFTFSVKSDGSDSPGFAIAKVNPVATPTMGDPQVYFAEQSGKLNAYIQASDIVALGGATIVAEGTYIDVSLAGSTYTVNVDVTEFPNYDGTKNQLTWHNSSGSFSWMTTASYDATKQQILWNNNGTWEWKTTVGYNAALPAQLLGQQSGVWTWATPEAWLALVNGYNSAATQSIGKDAGSGPEWQNDGTC